MGLSLESKGYLRYYAHGIVLNVNKCCLEPSQTGKWLSFIVDLSGGKFHVPACKLDKLKAFVESIYSFPEFQCAF